MQSVTKAHLHLFTCHLQSQSAVALNGLSVLTEYCDSVKEILGYSWDSTEKCDQFSITVAPNGKRHRYEEDKEKGSSGFPRQSSGWYFVLPLQGPGVQSLVGELRSHMLHGTTKKKWQLFCSYFFFLCPFATTHVGMEDKSLLLCSPLEEVE